MILFYLLNIIKINYLMNYLYPKKNIFIRFLKSYFVKPFSKLEFIHELQQKIISSTNINNYSKF